MPMSHTPNSEHHESEIHPGEGVHYGHKFAETGRILQEKREAREHTLKAASPEAPAPLPAADAETSRAPEPVEAMSLVSEVLGRVEKSFELYFHAAHDVRTATVSLLRLPLDVFLGRVKNR